MTIGEIIRKVDSYNRMRKVAAREKASYDYLQANTIANLIGHILGDKGEPPKIEDIYPTLFKKEEKDENEMVQETAKKDIAKVMAFAAAFNKKFEGGQSKE